MSEKRLSTGIGGLDRALDGGVPPGSLVAVTAEADSPAERIPYAFAEAHPARYYSTLRPGGVVDEAMTAAAGGLDGFDFRDGEETPTRVQDAREGDLLQGPGDRFASLSAGETVVVDPVNTLERADRGAYRAFLESLTGGLRSAGGIGVLHAQDVPETPASRELTLALADVTLDLRMLVDDRVAWELVVTKFRRGDVPTEPLAIVFDDGVRVDETRELR
ncbi:hypothetical protein DP107_11315 [Haloglomus irregulare]|uniref:RecA-superfamily ATPase, KaiC/GvpD/RAD55 family n=1 Tax=Haloglomus irregulare TaxID=2234134 RepID=A0A554N8M9_9EURY|nr:hypothetical protein [Haloglomus irregulare]TSD13748.1 hypothetical protein DP107_11315 [Haloglomus irregulare]